MRQRVDSGVDDGRRNANAAGLADSLGPSGLRGEGVQVFSIMTCGTSSARGIA